MVSPEIRVQVLLYSEKGTGQPLPCPPGVAIQLKRKGPGARTIPPTDLTTGVGGIASPVTLAEGTYQVNITDSRFTLWDAVADLEVSRPADEVLAAAAAGVVAGKEPPTEAEQVALEKAVAEAEKEALAEAVAEAEVREVRLVPPAGHRLVLVRLVTEGGQPVSGGNVRIAAGDGSPDETFAAFPDGDIYAVAPMGAVMLTLASADVLGTRYCPQASVIPYTVATVGEVKPLEFIYWPAIQIAATPTVMMNGVSSPLFGTRVTVEYRVSAEESGTSRTKTLTQSADPMAIPEISFEYPFSGEYQVTVEPPLTWTDLPIEAQPPAQAQDRTLLPGSWAALSPGPPWTVPAGFAVVPTEEITILVTTPDGQQLAGNPQFTISYGSASTTVPVSPKDNKAGATVPRDVTAKISLVPGTAKIGHVPLIGDVPLKMSTPDQGVTPDVNTVTLEYEYPLTITALDEHGEQVAGAMVDVFDRYQNPVGSGVTDETGSFVIGLGGGGTYYVSQHSVNGQPGMREHAQVSSPGAVSIRIKGPAGEALTDLGAYPVLTEEVSTTGIPAPVSGGPGGGGTGAGYGQVVDQAMREVLGWRPGGDVAGFQAALTGAFQLQEVEGHTQWAWQQRGYAVQADMGALTGAQASIYARAKSALDQMLPLLAGLTSLNPAVSPEQDRESIRTVVLAELQELVGELALEGGPRIQRVDELFSLLLGDSIGSTNLNPDIVQGQIGTLRERFALTADWIETVDDEHVVTNFRVVVEQILALQASWSTDRTLLSVVDSRTSLGTVLIWLSRGLEAVCESVSDLTFALDSVYIDAAQRQVIELDFGDGQPPLLLSDLLDWVVRASRDEGPRLIQDAGKDGVRAFAPVLRQLRGLLRQSMQAAKDPTLPPGIRTPRVTRAFQVLYDQVREATRLAGLVQLDQAPLITKSSASTNQDTGLVTVMLTGANFRAPASAVLVVENREDIPDVPSRFAKVTGPTSATATFRIPRQGPGSGRSNWQVVLINGDGTQSYPPAPIQIPG